MYLCYEMIVSLRDLGAEYCCLNVKAHIFEYLVSTQQLLLFWKVVESFRSGTSDDD